MKQYKYGYYRLKKENVKLKEQLQSIREGKACINCIDIQNGECKFCKVVVC